MGAKGSAGSCFSVGNGEGEEKGRRRQSSVWKRESGGVRKKEKRQATPGRRER